MGSAISIHYFARVPLQECQGPGNPSINFRKWDRGGFIRRPQFLGSQPDAGSNHTISLTPLKRVVSSIIWNYMIIFRLLSVLVPSAG